MFKPFHVAATGLNTFEQEFLDITNNLSNAQTVGFKKGRTEKESLYYVEPSFKQVLAETEAKQQGLDSPPGTNVSFGSGVRIVATPRDFTQGATEVTKNPLDIAVQGDGFIQMRMPDGSTAYTRAGNLKMDADGNLVDASGHLLEPAITIPAGTTQINISSKGLVSVSINNSLNQREVGQIQLARFTNPAGLKTIGQNLYESTVASGDPQLGIAGEDGFGTITQFALEGSNVDVISELARLIITQRVFNTITKAVQTYEQMLTSLDRIRQG